MMLEDVLREVQPQTEVEAKNTLLCVTGVSPMQVVFGRNPEIPSDLLQEGPDLVANSAILNNETGAQQARVRAVARMQVLIQQDKLHTRRALDTRPRRLHKHLPGEMVCVWRQVANKGVPKKRAHHRWPPRICMGEVRGHYWVAMPGSVVKGVTRAAALSDSGGASRMAFGGG